jgi:hypothetical protein
MTIYVRSVKCMVGLNFDFCVLSRVPLNAVCILTCLTNLGLLTRFKEHHAQKFLKSSFFIIKYI